jgi:ubiquinone biosynthesis protein COQ4
MKEKLQYKLKPKQAYNAFRRLRKNPTNTIFVYEFLNATTLPALRSTYNRLLESDLGGKIAYESEEVSEYFNSLSDRPQNSVGKECHKLFPDQEILARLSRRKAPNKEWIDKKHPYNWMARRWRDTHDTWHTLTGYPSNDIGEMQLAMFSFAQTGSMGWFLIGVAIMLKYGVTMSHLTMMYRAYKSGKRAEFLLAEDYNQLLSENLSEARTRLKIYG